MDVTALRALQAPLKDKYREAPESGVVTLKACGELDDQHIACKVETGRAIALAGLHPATGGSGAELCSGDMLLEALVACAGVTRKAVATALEIELKKGVVHAEGAEEVELARRLLTLDGHGRIHRRLVDEGQRAAGVAQVVEGTRLDERFDGALVAHL